MTERPEECTQCKKPIAVLYKEINDKSTICTNMCADCPVLLAKLHGDRNTSTKNLKEDYLHCGTCGTNSEAIRTGNGLGCSSCYEVFAELIFSELLHTRELPSYSEKKWEQYKTEPLHIGKSPKQATMLPKSSKLSTLHEALNEALKKENYEQAASLRDQIKKITETNS